MNIKEETYLFKSYCVKSMTEQLLQSYYFSSTFSNISAMFYDPNGLDYYVRSTRT